MTLKLLYIAAGASSGHANIIPSNVSVMNTDTVHLTIYSDYTAHSGIDKLQLSATSYSIRDHHQLQ